MSDHTPASRQFVGVDPNGPCFVIDNSPTPGDGHMEHDWSPWLGGPIQQHRWCRRCDVSETR